MRKMSGSPNALVDLESPAESSPPETNEGVAIIGMAGRFPGAANIAEYWNNLRAGTESIMFFTPEELLAEGIGADILGNPNFVRANGLLQNADLFDAGYFGFTPREAELLDPQQRILLECAVHAFEDAGYDPERLDVPVSVFAGSSLSTYLFNLLSHPKIAQLVGGTQLLIANDKDHLTTQISYKLNLRGPSITVQTACSTSLVAVCMACQSLLTHQSDLALAGGVSIKFPQRTGYLFQEGMINSPDGHCRAFDRDARGTVNGNGGGLVLLKRLSDAVADRDPIRSIVLASAMNNDGSGKVGYTAPSVTGESEAILMTHLIAGIDPASVSYVEAHGTGTPLGDPVEIAALTQAFRAGTERRRFCGIGSVKTNIGHLDAGAGVAGLVKATLMLERRQLVPSLHFEKPNAQIDFDNSPFYVVKAAAPWPEGPTPRRAGVSSFGIGGTNAHVLLQESPPSPRAPSARPQELITLSARSDAGVETLANELAAHLSEALESHEPGYLSDAAFTLHMGRKSHAHRLALVAATAAEAAEALRDASSRRRIAGKARSGAEVIFMFPGQGSQYPGMASGLYESEPLFRQHLDRCCEQLRPHLSLDLRELLIRRVNGPVDAANEASQAARLAQTELAQPALFAVGYALAQLWMAWGVRPSAFIGHSIGELLAACLAGVFSRDDALGLVARRARLMQGMPPGAMLSIALPEADITRRIRAYPELALAVVNGREHVVVSGPTEAVSRLQLQLEQESAACRRLHTSHAFHSPMMEPAACAFAEAVARVKRHAPKIPYVSNLTGAWATAELACDPAYWGRQLRESVQFAAGVRLLLEKPQRMFLEVGPGNTLCTLVRTQLSVGDTRLLAASLASTGRPRSSRSFASGDSDETSSATSMLQSLGRLWSAGIQVDWSGFWKDRPRRRVSLPGYPFERQRYWIDRVEPRAEQSVIVKRPNVAEWLYAPAWKLASPDDASHRAGGRLSEGTGLLFVDDSAAGRAIADELRQHCGQNICVVVPGEAFSAENCDRVTLRPDTAQDYVALMERLHADGRSVSVIWHLWSVGRPDRSWDVLRGKGTASANALLSGFADSQCRGFNSLLFLAQALGEAADRPRVLLLAVTNFAHRVTGFERCIQPAKATVLGPVRVIPAEYPNISSRSVDVDFDPSISNPGSGALKVLVAQLLAESRGAPAMDAARAGAALVDQAAVAYRGNRRFARFFDAVAALPAISPRLRPSGVYLITGGLGGIGLALARHLARAVRARLVLVSRSSLPERDSWPAWLREHDAEDETSRRIRRFQELEECGGEVMVVRADVTDPGQMQSAVRRARERFGALHGIIHAAGVPGGGLIGLKTPQAAAAVVAPKGPGTLALYAAVLEQQSEPLDFFALCSSLASLLGIVGQIDYCAANAFLDAFAAASAGAKGAVPLIAINWDTWQEAGMAVNTKIPKHLEASRRESLERGIRDDEGAAAFLQVLACGEAHVAVSTSELPALAASFVRAGRAAQVPADDGGPVSSESAPATLGSRHARPNLGIPYAAPATPAEQAIAGIWQELFGIEAIGVDDDFFELGGHSLLIVQIIARVRTSLGVEVPIRSLFESPTIRGLAARAAGSGAPADAFPVATPVPEELIEDDYADVSTDQLAAALEAAERLPT